MGLSDYLPAVAAGVLGMTSPIGALVGYGAYSTWDQRRREQQNYKVQKEFAQHGLTWRTADALRSGIHPLAAVGANISAGRPTSVGRTGLTKMGQYMAELQIQKGLATSKMGLDNAMGQYYRAQADSIKGSKPKISPTGYTEPGSGTVQTQEKVPFQSYFGIASGNPPLFQYRSAPGVKGGSYYLMFHKDASEIMEQDIYNNIKVNLIRFTEHLRGTWDFSKQQMDYITGVMKTIKVEQGYKVLWSRSMGNPVRRRLTEQNRNAIFLSEPRPKSRKTQDRTMFDNLPH